MNVLLPVNLQFFSQEKTEKATPQKRQESRRKGQVAKSAEVSMAFIMLGVFLFLYFSGGWMLEGFLTIFKANFFEYIHWEITPYTVRTLFEQMTLAAIKIAAPVMVIAFVFAVFSNYIQVGFLFTAEPLKAKFERINPIQGAKRIFSVRSLVELLKSLFKIGLISTVVGLLLWLKKDEVFLLSQKSIGDGLVLVGSLTVQIGLTVAIILLFLSLLDYMYQRFEFEKNIRMSKQDIKDEYKKSEGDPLVKSKRREKQREMSMNRMMQEVPHADVVITNPTHYAVALKYDAVNMNAPTITAMGKDFVAQKIKETAKEHGVVIMENKPLARALYAQAEIGDVVPEELFQAVAEVLAYVYSLKGSVR
jgi:flagellar biosynthesis protein FlhB